MTKAIPFRERFERRFMPVTECGCWIWLGFRDSYGYGHMHINYKRYKAHRLSWELYRGTLPADMDVLHKCDQPLCVNPDHLFLGTQLDNMRDMIRKGRGSHQKQTHCKRGHPFTGLNLFINKSGRRICRECCRVAALKHSHKKKGLPSWQPTNPPPRTLKLSPRTRRAP